MYLLSLLHHNLPGNKTLINSSSVVKFILGSTGMSTWGISSSPCLATGQVVWAVRVMPRVCKASEDLYKNTHCWLYRCCSWLKEEKLRALKVLCFHFVAAGDCWMAIRGGRQSFPSQPKSLTSDTQMEICAGSVLSVSISHSHHSGRARRKAQLRPVQL